MQKSRWINGKTCSKGHILPALLFEHRPSSALSPALISGDLFLPPSGGVTCPCRGVGSGGCQPPASVPGPLPYPGAASVLIPSWVRNQPRGRFPVPYLIWIQHLFRGCDPGVLTTSPAPGTGVRRFSPPRLIIAPHPRCPKGFYSRGCHPAGARVR